MSTPLKAKSAGRKDFVRTRVPGAEYVASAVILALIVVTGYAIYHKGQHFDPHLYEVRTESLKSTQAAVEGKDGTAPSAPLAAATSVSPPKAVAESGPAGEESSGYGDAGMDHSSTEPAAPALTKEPLDLALAGTKPMGDTEFYTSDNLYEKIDGRAPAYQNFNVQQLRCRSFSLKSAPDSYVDVYEYRFDTPVNAFGMFALERDPKGKPLDFVADGYAADMGYFFRQGAVYVQIIASDTKPETLAKAKSIADIRAKNLPVDDSGLAGRRKLPAAGLIADSISYVPDNAQGQATLKDVFQAKYQFDHAELPFFVMVATPDDAAKAWASFKDFCGRFGTVESLPEANGAKLFRAQVFGKWKVVYENAGELGGVFDAEDPAKAQAFVEKYLRGELN